MAHHAPTLELDRVHLALAGRPVVEDLSLRVASGEFVAVVGPSGCGKSTLLSLIAGLRQPDRGRVTVDGQPATARLGTLTLLPQRDALLPWRTVGDNVALGARLSGSTAAEATHTARRALERYGLADVIDHYPHALSGGMRQRASLARAVVGDGAWLLDEPLGALDALTRSQAQAELAAIWGERRPTTVLVTHDLDEALRLADRVVVCSPAPARVVAEVSVTMPHPRSDDEAVRSALAPQRATLRRALGAA